MIFINFCRVSGVTKDIIVRRLEYMRNAYDILIGELIDTLAPITKASGGPTGKSGASLSGKNLGKSGFLSSSGGKNSTFGSSGSKTSGFGSGVSKTSAFGSTTSKTSSFGPVLGKSSKTPILGSSGKTSSGLTPSTSRKTYETVSYNPKNAKSSTSFGIIWLPGRKRNKTKDLAYSSINYDKKPDSRSPSMYNFMSGDSPDFQKHKKDEEVGLLVPDKLKGPIATVASAGAIATIAETPSDSTVANPEEKLLNHEKEESKEAAGDANDEDTDYLENKDVATKIPEENDKSNDKVDNVYVSPPSAIKPPPQSTTSNPDEDDCVIKCLYYTLQCCDCVLM